MLITYSKFLSKVEKVICVIIAIMMFVMMAVMCYQVMLRYVFAKSNIWSEELTRFLFVWVSLLGSFVAIRRNCHLKVEFFVNLLKGNFKKYFTLITDIAVSLFLIYLIPLSYNLCLGTIKNLSAGLKIPMAVGYAAIPVGSVLMLLAMAEQILIKVSDKKSERISKDKESEAAR